MFERYKYLLSISMQAVMVNRYRSVLTALGIIFGVASVIAMMAIGRGAQKEILDQMKLVGINNIIITPAGGKQAAHSADSAGSQPGVSREGQQRFSPGLTVYDVQPIAEIFPNAGIVSPEINLSTHALANGRNMPVELTGVTTGFFSVFGLSVTSGSLFTRNQMSLASPVCIIGPSVRASLFPAMDPLGRSIRCGNVWLTITGILGKTQGNASSLGKLGISDYNTSIYIPLNTMQSRFGNRMNPTPGESPGNLRYNTTSSGTASDTPGRSGIDKIVVQLHDPRQMTATAAVLKRLLKRLHNGVEDFQVVIPELLLKNEKRARNIFNIVLSAIAGISLLVGGIGIMNIMMTSVVERTKEIGIRLSIGAKKNDIVFQFLAESAMISLAGGVIGILLGIILAMIIRYFAGIPTIITLLSVLVSFGISVSVGIVFGYLPAKRASLQDPVASLRYE
jgi:putative ABC transport system permease protein